MTKPRRAATSPKPRSKPTAAPRKRPTQERAVATVEALLQATAYILVKDGYAKLTTNRVADKAGVNIASLYQYFPNKDALVAELQRRHVESTRARAKEVFAAHAGASLRATIRAIVESSIAAHTVEPELHRVFDDEMPKLRGKHLPPDDPMTEQRQAWLRQAGLRYEHEELVAWLVRTVAHAAIHRGVVERPEDLRSGALGDELVVLLERYLRARQGPRSPDEENSGAPKRARR